MATTQRDEFQQYASSKRTATLSLSSLCHLRWKLELPSLRYQNSKAGGKGKQIRLRVLRFWKEIKSVFPTNRPPCSRPFLCHFIMCLIVFWNPPVWGPSFCDLTISWMPGCWELFVDLVQTLSCVHTLLHTWPRVCAVAPFMRLINLNHGHCCCVWRGV